MKERKVNDYSLQWGRKHGGCRNNDKDKQLNQGWRRGSQGELEEKGRVFQVKEAAMMLREMGNQSRVSWPVLNSSALSRVVPTLQASCEN